MPSETRRFGWFGLFIRLALMLGLFAAVGVAEDEQPKAGAAPAPSPSAQPAPATPKADKPADKPADKSGNKAGAQNDDDSDDYEKNAAKRFTPTERTPADRNVSFPVDI